MPRQPVTGAMVSFKIPADLRAQIDAIATIENVTMSDIVRRALRIGVTSLTMNRGSTITTIHGREEADGEPT